MGGDCKKNFTLCTPFSLQSNSDHFDDCSRLLQMKSEKIIHIPTTSSKMKKNTHARVHCSEKQGILDRESLNAMDFRPQNL